MFIVYKPLKIKKNLWTLVHPENSNSRIGFFKTQKAAQQYVINTMATIINK